MEGAAEVAVVSVAAAATASALGIRIGAALTASEGRTVTEAAVAPTAIATAAAVVVTGTEVVRTAIETRARLLSHPTLLPLLPPLRHLLLLTRLGARRNTGWPRMALRRSLPGTDVM